MQDTLRQIQEIRTYYDFPDIDIDRYEIDGSLRQMMLATRELNVERLPESSRNWINEKLIYTHGYGITMNPVNGFTPEGLPDLVLGNMPVQSTVPELTLTRPEIYFGELTNTDVYVKTRQQEFNYPQGDTNSLTSYEGTGGVPLGGLLRRLLIAVDRGDIMRLPFSDKAISVPNGFYFDLATWHRIDLHYTPKVSRDLAELERDRFLYVCAAVPAMNPLTLFV